MKIAILLALFSILATSPTVVADKPPDSNGGMQNQECISNDDGECTVNPSSSVYVIGDLHGDAICAVSWVNRTGLVANLLDEDLSSAETVPLFKKLNNPSEWRWTDDEATLVFMGDYIDKGPTSRQTVEFVKDLTDAFPDKITAILGNHELELLRDRDVRIKPVDRYSAYSYAVVHPGEYHNYFNDPKQTSFVREADPSDSHVPRALDEKDDLVLDLLYEAGMEVYTARAHSAVRYVPSLPDHTDDHRKRGIRFAITDIIPPQHRQLARERLGEYIDAYLDAFRSGTALGDWVERRPIMHLAEDIRTLFVHGGVSENVGKSHLWEGKKSVDKLNSIWWDHSHEGKLYDFLNGKGISLEDIMGYVVYELLTYRGNHPGYGKWETHGTYEESASDDDKVCETLHDMLSHMEGIDRIAVGHTPEDDIRVMCNGAFLALDSTLGRW
eukprot:CAMPEP_0172537846 /NCGR_PEP_ID=MMETSP1067-20121228/9374_1 /TAXON_ID=265564 ORGANISM="Thalassiosira punctigera, Strain Tpunct2005C2" /NCGR_SAMPLE_ID=MMETSP1067 /ASSEMBLY_ACC=CAM_ASM_000444 /LENGTH=441 /DNA_ID=CAMNT_0013323237 /DNA_START=122 /DNA_END=1444 /DNA_ORIENTATION=+